MWSQDNNNGPRTTNDAEGWHNRIRTRSFSHLHSDLGCFIHELQIEHNSQRRRLTNLQNGKTDPEEKGEIQIWKEELIVQEKQQFMQYWTWASNNNIMINYDQLLHYCTQMAYF